MFCFSVWDKKVRNGHIKRITDQDIQVLLLLLCVIIKLSYHDMIHESVKTEQAWSSVIIAFLVVRPGDRRDERQHHLRHLPRGPQEDPGHQAALPRHDRQEHEEILHI